MYVRSALLSSILLFILPSRRNDVSVTPKRLWAPLDLSKFLESEVHILRDEEIKQIVEGG